MQKAVDVASGFYAEVLAGPPHRYVPPHVTVLLIRIARLAIGLLSIRMLSVTGLVIALWLCPVQTFANVGLYLAAVNLGAMVVFGRYELLMIAADGERRCADAFHLCVLTGVFSIVVTVAVAITIHHLLITQVPLAFAAALLFRAWLRLGLTLATRYGRYQHAVRSLVPHAVAQPMILVCLINKGYDAFLAFVVADLLGHMIAALGVCLSERDNFVAMLQQPLRFRKLSELASSNIALPTLNLTTAASAFLFTTAPLFCLPSLSNGILAGTLALLFRLLELPTSITASSLGPILLKEIADRKRSHILWTSKVAFLLPAAIAIVVFGFISLGAATLNNLELASSWHLALTLLPVVALFQASITAALPLIDIATLAGRHKGLFAFNVVSVVLAGAALLLWRADPIFAILTAGSIGFARVLIMSAWLARSVRVQTLAAFPL